MTEQWHSYRVGEVVDGEVRMYDDPIDDGPLKLVTPEEFMRGVDRLKTAVGVTAEEAMRLGDSIRAVAEKISPPLTGSDTP